MTIPLNIGASRVVAEVLQGRPAILHHHDPPWQRQRFADVTDLPPDDPHWRHVVVNELTLRELRDRHGIEATYIANVFDVDALRGDRPAPATCCRSQTTKGCCSTRCARSKGRTCLPRLALAEAVAGTYWLTGPPEEGYEATLDGLLARTSVRVIREPIDGAIGLGDGYAVCDAVLFPSTWEGFGNPPIEAAIYQRPAAVGTYPVAAEMRALGFRWLPTDDPEPLAAVLEQGADPLDLAHNHACAARTDFSTERLRREPQGAPRRGRLVAVSDPILVKRACALPSSRNLGQRLGYLGFVIAIVVFVIGAIVGFNGAIVGIVIGSIVVGSIFLAPSIVLGYAVKAAEKEDRAKGR